MAYDQELAERVENALQGKRQWVVKKMFGGLGFMLRGNMCLGVWQEFLIVRVGAENYESALAEPFTEEFDITGKSLTGWVMVEPEGVETDQTLKKWMDQGIAFTKTLPSK